MMWITVFLTSNRVEYLFIYSGSMKSYLVVKIGDPTASYQTTIYIRVTDLYKNYVEIPVLIQVRRSYVYKTSTEPAHEMIVLFGLRKFILQTRMCRHPVGLDV